jgi:hypothetical protein
VTASPTRTRPRPRSRRDPTIVEPFLSWFEHATESVLEALTTTPAETEVWTWGADFTGTSPNTGNTYDQPTPLVADASRAVPSFVARADAAELDLWLWGRGDVARIEVEGDRDAFTRLTEIVERGTQ